ncbi:DNA double-strand break repair nuclease NurA [Thermococcus argininiproducens]|uniref:DNA double-strand break repair nuclease NurA n=1 Tax=Thermococcus argininiproducens TaxID=2866384 RepID=A0A9E7M8K2_9EURY|nr:DNA double-strand break repair nuclease NurA [Thermococcus argininiproducens]USG99384.1 DNA double-strand break repair nuclease NurA [Thermococcus argininiproducens]
MEELYKQILEKKKQLEFRLTEGEILVQLIQRAKELSSESKRLFDKLDENSKKLLAQQDLVFSIEKEFSPPRLSMATGIDGSFQVVGGLGGKWYVPLSSVTIYFEDYLSKKPTIKYFATIETIEAIDESQAKKYASYLMLGLETDEIDKFVSKTPESSYIFLDGPIVDPPVMSENPYLDPSHYTEVRVDAIKNGIIHGHILVGCMKRIRDRQFVYYLEKIFDTNLSIFHNDLYLVGSLFKQYRTQNNFYGPLYTEPFVQDKINTDDMYRKYYQKGIHIYSFFYQKDAFSSILRVDIAQLDNKINKREFTDLLNALTFWILPGHGLPLPALLAHEKCTIKEGCAQVLYDEILTKESTENPLFKLWIR